MCPWHRPQPSSLDVIATADAYSERTIRDSVESHVNESQGGPSLAALLEQRLPRQTRDRLIRAVLRRVIVERARLASQSAQGLRGFVAAVFKFLSESFNFSLVHCVHPHVFHRQKLRVLISMSGLTALVSSAQFQSLSSRFVFLSHRSPGRLARGSPHAEGKSRKSEAERASGFRSRQTVERERRA